MLSLTVAIRTLIISDKGPAADNGSVLADSSWGVNIVKLRFGGFGFYPRGDGILEIPIYTRGRAVFSGI